MRCNNNYIKLLRENIGFRALFTRDFLATFGWSLSEIAVTSIIVSLWDNPISMGLYLSLDGICAIVYSLFTGMIIDKYNKPKIMMYCDIAAAIMRALLVVSNITSSLWLVFIIRVFYTLKSSLTKPAADSFLPCVVSRDDIITANTLTETVTGAIYILAMGVGGMTVSYIGINYTILIDVFLFLFAALIVSTFIFAPHWYTISSDESEAKRTNERKSWRLMFTEAIELFRIRRDLRDIVVVKFILNCTVLGMFVIAPFIAKNMFNNLTKEAKNKIAMPLGILYGVAGIGGTISPLIANMFVRGNNQLMRKWLCIPILCIAIGSGIYSFILSRSNYRGYEIPWLISYFLTDSGNITIYVWMKTIMQTEVESDILGRVMTIAYAARVLSSTIAYLIASIVLEYTTGISKLLFVLTAVNGGLAIWWIKKYTCGRIPDNIDNERLGQLRRGDVDEGDSDVNYLLDDDYHDDYNDNLDDFLSDDSEV